MESEEDFKRIIRKKFPRNRTVYLCKESSTDSPLPQTSNVKFNNGDNLNGQNQTFRKSPQITPISNTVPYPLVSPIIHQNSSDTQVGHNNPEEFSSIAGQRSRYKDFVRSSPMTYHGFEKDISKAINIGESQQFRSLPLNSFKNLPSTSTGIKNSPLQEEPALALTKCNIPSLVPDQNTLCLPLNAEYVIYDMDRVYQNNSGYPAPFQATPLSNNHSSQLISNVPRKETVSNSTFEGKSCSNSLTRKESVISSPEGFSLHLSPTTLSDVSPREASGSPLKMSPFKNYNRQDAMMPVGQPSYPETGGFHHASVEKDYRTLNPELLQQANESCNRKERLPSVIVNSNSRENSSSEPPRLIFYQESSCDSYLFSSTDTGSESSYFSPSPSTFNPYPDTTCMDPDEILSIISIPDFSPHHPEAGTLNDIMEPHEVGHLNHIIKCYADSALSINALNAKSDCHPLNTTDFIDIHLCGVLQVYFMLFKMKDFVDLSLTEQNILLRSGILPGLLALGIPRYQIETKGFQIPRISSGKSPIFLSVFDFSDLISKRFIDRTIRVYEISDKLKVDWTISTLLLLAFIFTPLDTNTFENEKITEVRNQYMKLMLKYLRWKHGTANAILLYPELLKLMDAILRHCLELQEIQLCLSNDELSYIHNQMINFKFEVFSNFSSEQREKGIQLLREEVPFEILSLYILHSKLSSIITESFYHMSNNVSFSGQSIQLQEMIQQTS